MIFVIILLIIIIIILLFGRDGFFGLLEKLFAGGLILLAIGVFLFIVLILLLAAN